MIEMIQNYMSKKHNYTLNEYAVFETEHEKSKMVLPALIIFVIFLILFVLGRANVVGDWISTPILIFAFVVFVLLPLALRKGTKYDAIIVTPEYIIQRVSKTEFISVKYDNVTKFVLNDTGIVIKGKGATITLGLEMFREELEPIIDILEAKGKTFDPEKEYMIRPIEIHIKDNKIIITDVEEEVIVDKLFEKFVSEYPMLTPGFLEEIIFRNSVVDCSSVEDSNIIFCLDGFEVKGGHPENTTFGSIDVTDCIVIFENVDVESIFLQDLHEGVKSDNELDPFLDNIRKNVEKSVITHWKVSGNHLDMHFQTGVHTLKTSFDFDQVIIGWKEIKNK